MIKIQEYGRLLTLNAFIRYCTVALFFTALALPLRAEQVEGLYEAVVPVPEQSQRALAKATREGFKEVLIRVSGKRSVLSEPSLSSAIGRAATFVRQYGYESYRSEIDDSEALMVVIEFEKQLIDRLLRSSGLPIWSSNRPSLLAWLVVQDSDGRRFASVDRDPDIIEAIRRDAERRGLAIKLPALDLEDMVAMSPDDLWRLNTEKNRSAIERYQSDAVLLGKVTQLTNGDWLGRWSYYNDQQQSTFDGEADNVSAYIAHAVDQVAEWMAAQYAVVPVNMASGGVIMRITGINDFVDYARAIAYLESVAAIRHANVVSIEGADIVVQLSADGEKSQLQQALALGQQLEPNIDTFYFGEYALDLDYHWPKSVSESPSEGVNSTVSEFEIEQ